MLALQASRGWNYQATSGGQSVTVSLYVNQSTVGTGEFVLAAAGLPGLHTTALVDHATAESNLVGGLGITPSTSGYNVNAEISVGSAAAVPGNPLLVGSTLTQGATSTPYAGVTETVMSVGTVPGATACPTPAAGAQVRYTFQNTSYTVSYVPGCGITQVVGPSGVPFTLTSVGSYPTIGNLSVARKVASVTLADTARSLLGLERNDFPAARLFR
ncbi:MAG: hypothetical protein JO103_07405 [Candidatus Eremiobacteraeota bacterium]|nr:hypothetical protein [Candidatus Eremiobacteraeota bacterium]